MREIKFRAWDKITETYFEFGFQDIQDGLVEITGEHEVEQFTGLKDKNGKEGYANDICQANYYCGFDSEPHKLIGTIEWSDADLCWMFDYGHGSMPLISEKLDDIEIIGNIHENSDLLDLPADNSAVS